MYVYIYIYISIYTFTHINIYTCVPERGAAGAAVAPALCALSSTPTAVFVLKTSVLTIPGSRFRTKTSQNRT